MNPESLYVVGVDLGSGRDFTAITILSTEVTHADPAPEVRALPPAGSPQE